MCDPIVMGGMAFGQGAFSAFSGASQAKARNQAAIRNYEYQLKQREANWYQQLSIWGARRNKYHNEINENDLAAQRGYSQAQVGLNNVFAQAAQRNEGALIKYLQGHGKHTAAGRTGKSIDRINTLDLGMLEREAGKNYYAITQSKEAYKANVDNIRNQQISHRNKLYSNVAFEPVPDLAPPPPVLENQSPGMGLAMAALSGITAYGSAGGSFGKGKGMFSKSGNSFLGKDYNITGGWKPDPNAFNSVSSGLGNPMQYFQNPSAFQNLNLGNFAVNKLPFTNTDFSTSGFNAGQFFGLNQ